ncbi:hypothetical protein HJFPF1_04456 [Paramyrothecium foliicola]|nr:hypothetical protein HJFPF1_04456 [Paramyrothecium foliicola]
MDFPFPAILRLTSYLEDLTICEQPGQHLTMHFKNLLATALAAGVTANGVSHDDRRYPKCPENYETYCCFTVVPYSTSCRRGRCTNEPGWSCVMGAGKVDSIRICQKEYDEKTAYCKRPGYKYFGSILKWSYGGFSPMLEPSDYRRYLKPGMERPWVPSYEEVEWEEAEPTEAVIASELRKREPVMDDVDFS